MKAKVFAVLLFMAVVGLSTSSTMFFIPLFPAKFLPHVVGAGAVAVAKLKALAAFKAYNYWQEHGGAWNITSTGMDVNFDADEAGWNEVQTEVKVVDRAAVLAKVDEYNKMDCGLKLMCELSTLPEDRLTEEEKILMNSYGSVDKLETADAESEEKILYVNAANLGKSSKDVSVCESVYFTCPHKATVIMATLKEAAA